MVSKAGNNNMSDVKNAVTGLGEFQLREVHIMATVEAIEGVVCQIKFQTKKGEEVPGAVRVVERLLGQPIAKVLELQIDQLDEIERPEEKVVLLESFHRAVESCLDDE
jgi:hypothetical protein